MCGSDFPNRDYLFLSMCSVNIVSARGAYLTRVDDSEIEPTTASATSREIVRPRWNYRLEPCRVRAICRHLWM